MSVLAPALKRLALSHGTVPSAVPAGRSLASGTNGTHGTVGTVGTHGPVIASYLDRLRSHPCPDDVSPERFKRLRQGAVRFASRWAAEAVRLGWSLDELFAIAEPYANVSLQGAAWFVGDPDVIEVTAAAITVRTASGASQRIYRRSLQ